VSPPLLVGVRLNLFIERGVHQLSAFIHDCFLIRTFLVDPLNSEDDFDASESEGVSLCASAGSGHASDVGDKFASFSTDNPDVFLIYSRVNLESLLPLPE